MARGRTMTTTFVRPDYQKHMYWTRGEAAQFVGLSPNTIRDWEKRPIRGRHRWKRGHRLGPYTVDSTSFKRFVRDGVPDGETCHRERKRLEQLQAATAKEMSG